jgi:hypothetical protein
MELHITAVIQVVLAVAPVQHQEVQAVEQDQQEATMLWVVADIPVA